MDKATIPEQLPYSFNAFGEAPLPESPAATLSNGQQVVPQQFFHYCRTVENVEHIVSLIAFSNDLPIFVFQENDHVFLQIGIVGHENYPPVAHQTSLRNDKIVYGRRWYIDPYMPTSEVIQTAFLAINKAREHELREFFSADLVHRGKRHTATMFNTHIDLPLAAANRDLFRHDEAILDESSFRANIEEKLTSLSLSSFNLCLEDMKAVNAECWAVTIRCQQCDNGKAAHRHRIEHYFPELVNEPLCFLCRANLSHFLHELMAVMIKKSEDYVAEHFTFDGFKRFSKSIHPDDLAAFSIETRVLDTERTASFKQLFASMVELVDGEKAPKMAQSKTLSDQQSQSLQQRHALEGFLPR